jgi:hypothetical protein
MKIYITYKNANTVLVGNPERMRPLERWHRWQDIITG